MTSGASDRIFMYSSVAELAGHGPKDTGALRVVVICAVDENGGVLVKTDVGAVRAADALGGADDNGLDHIALLDAAARGGLADAGDDDVAHVAVLALGAAQNTDSLELLGAGVVGNLQIRFQPGSFLRRLLTSPFR